MPELDHIVFHELSLIDKIIRDETWLEGERRGCFVPASDPVVRENICKVILRVGAQVRKAAMDQIATEAGAASDSEESQIRAA
jgi:hypothetical protein